MGYRYSYLKTEMPEKAEVLAKTPNEATRQLIQKIEDDGHETYLDRFALQQPQCRFG